MPWTPIDAKKFKKDISPQQKDRWASIANRVLSRTGDEGKAIRSANAATKGAIQRRLQQKNTSDIRSKGY